MKDPLTYRRPELVSALLGYVYEHDGARWPELVDVFSGSAPARTIEAVIYDLVAIGALHRVGKPGDRHRPDSRALRPTLLGAAWLEQRLHPLPGAPDEQDDDR